MKDIDKRLKDKLEEITIEYPSEDEVDRTIYALYEHMPAQKKQLKDYFEEMMNILRLSAQELLQFSLTFWLANLAFVLIGIAGTAYLDSSPYLTLLILAPLPFLTGLIEVFKLKDPGMLELEATTKYSLENLLFSRLLLVGVYNFLLNALLIVWLYYAEGLSLIVSQLFIYWIMPVSVLAALGLFVTLKFRGMLSSPALLSVWLAAGFGLSQIPGGADFLRNISIWVSTLVILCSILAIGIQLKRIKKDVFIETDSR